MSQHVWEFQSVITLLIVWACGEATHCGRSLMRSKLFTLWWLRSRGEGKEEKERQGKGERERKRGRKEE